MSDILELFKSLNDQLQVSNDSYVYYEEETGKIIKISNRQNHEEGLDILEVSHDQVKDILEGKRNTNEYIVSYDLSLKQLALKEVTYESDIESVSSSLHRLPVTQDFYDPDNPVKERVLEEIYDGVNVYVWIPRQQYFKNSLVWFNNNVYKLKEDINSEKFDLNLADLYVESVNLTDEKIILSDIKLEEHKKEYVGVFVDVWYKELKHVIGQHVWYKGTVYVYTEDQEKNKPFNYEAVEPLVSDVKLYDDENKHLEFDRIVEGDIYLDNNQLYSYSVSETNDLLTKKNILFYASDTEFLIYDSKIKNFVKALVTQKNDQAQLSYETIGINIPITTFSFFNKGDKVLLGKKIVQISDVDADIVVIQNKKTKTWSVRLSNSTRKFLESTGYKAHDKLYFSITAKYDPNILYRTIDFSLMNLLNDKVQTYNFDHDIENTDEVSVYTTQFFNLYTHEILS